MSDSEPVKQYSLTNVHSSRMRTAPALTLLPGPGGGGVGFMAWSEGGAGGWMLGQKGGVDVRTPSEQTDSCENITFAPYAAPAVII